jgi:DNA-binding transcriptional regulator YiaG
MTARAERKCGELLRDMAQRGERKTKGGDQRSNGAKSSDSVSLDQLGLHPKESQRFQQVAAVRARAAKLLTIPEAADALHVSVATLRRWLNATEVSPCPDDCPAKFTEVVS